MIGTTNFAWAEDFWKQPQFAKSALVTLRKLWWEEKCFPILLVLIAVPSNVVPRIPGEHCPLISSKVRHSLQQRRCVLCGTTVCPGYCVWSGKHTVRKQRCCHRKTSGMVEPVVFLSYWEVLWNGILHLLYSSPQSWHCTLVRNNTQKCSAWMWAYVPALLPVLGSFPGSWHHMALRLLLVNSTNLWTSNWYLS